MAEKPRDHTARTQRKERNNETQQISTVGIAYPRLYESLAFINGYKKADEAIEQLKSDIRKQLNLPENAEDFDIKFEETPKK